MFSDVDEHMESASTLAMERSSHAGEDLFDIAVVREEDSLGLEQSAELSDEEDPSSEECSSALRRNGSLASTLAPDKDRGRIAFLNFDGECFADAGSYSVFAGGSGGDEESGSSACERKSAFDLDSQCRSMAVEPLVRLAAGGISAAVLLYESYNTESSAFPYAKAAAGRIRETLSAVTEDQRLKSLKYRKKRRVNRVLIADNPAPKVVIFDVRTCLTFEDLNTQLRALVCGEGSGTLSQGTHRMPLLTLSLSSLERALRITLMHSTGLYFMSPFTPLYPVSIPSCLVFRYRLILKPYLCLAFPHSISLFCFFIFPVTP